MKPFSSLSETTLSKLHQIIRIENFRESETIYKQKDICSVIYILLDGHVMLSFDEGNAVAYDMKDQIIGFSNDRSGNKYICSCIALTKTYALVIDINKLEKLKSTQGDAFSLLANQCDTMMDQWMAL